MPERSQEPIQTHVTGIQPALEAAPFRAVFDQVNIVSGDPYRTIAFYRLLGVDLRDDRVFKASRGVSTRAQPNGRA